MIHPMTFQACWRCSLQKLYDISQMQPLEKKGWGKEKEKCYSNRHPRKSYRGGDGTETEDSKPSFEE